VRSAGILLYRRRGESLEVLLGHPGGPFWTRRDEGAWTIPKGEIGENEEPLAAARREFREEVGFAPEGPAMALEPLRQPSRKWIHAWAMEGDCDPASACSNFFEMEWPPKSGRMQSFPELDRVAWFAIEEARQRIIRGQAPFLAQLEALLRAEG
jgi:predicted NUDIX family NTP pyrophosphohydrolase